ncbi:MAG: hypothetical protein ACTTIC_04740 [Helicobacteraceae bacterium]
MEKTYEQERNAMMKMQSSGFMRFANRCIIINLLRLSYYGYKVLALLISSAKYR